MLKFFISSHGHFASGVKSSVDILLGDSDNITVFDAYIDQSSVQEHLDAFFETVAKDDQVFLLSDLYGGSVNRIMYLYLERPNTTLIAGVNLALVLELVSREEVSPEEVEDLVNSTRNLLRIVRIDEDSQEDSKEEEDFF